MPNHGRGNKQGRLTPSRKDQGPIAERLTLLYSREEIASRVKELAEAINGDYAGKELVIIGILKGTFVFLADLIRHLRLPVLVDFLGASSYGLASQSSQQVTLTRDIQLSIEGRDVLVMEDILDTGFTVNFVLNFLRQREPASLKLCALIDKTERRLVPVAADYVGFILQEGFIVGYGIDHAENYRHLPDIYRLEFTKD